MNLHRVLISSLASAAFVFGVAGCESCKIAPARVPGSKSATNMENSQWQVSGERAHETTPPETMPPEPMPPENK
ncbi:hypothetical protein BH09PLA1_BH09PLA1_25510 [soil metagenome]